MADKNSASYGGGGGGGTPRAVWGRAPWAQEAIPKDALSDRGRGGQLLMTNQLRRTNEARVRNHGWTLMDTDRTQEQGTVPPRTKWGQSHGALEPALSEPPRDDAERRPERSRRVSRARFLHSSDSVEMTGASRTGRTCPGHRRNEQRGTVPIWAIQSPFFLRAQRRNR